MNRLETTNIDKLKRIEEQRALKLECLRALIRDGDEAIESGDFSALHSDKKLDAFFAGI